MAALAAGEQRHSYPLRQCRGRGQCDLPLCQCVLWGVMTILVEVFDASGNRLGSGPIRTATAASVTRVLDGVGSYTIDLPGTDGRVLELLQPKRRVRVQLWDDQENKRELVRGIVEVIGAKDDASGWVLTV